MRIWSSLKLFLVDKWFNYLVKQTLLSNLR